MVSYDYVRMYFISTMIIIADDSDWKVVDDTQPLSKYCVVFVGM